MGKINPISQTIPGEGPEEFDAFAAEITRSCRPANGPERLLVERMIAHAWRLRRLLKAEAQAQTLRSEPKIMLRLRRMIAGVERSHQQAAADLQRLQARSPQPEIGPIQLLSVN